MRATALVKLFAAAWLLVACDRSSEMAFGPVDGSMQVHTIAGLKSRCHGNSTTIRESIAVRGIITANDRFGEHHKELVIEDASGGITIAVDATHLATGYPLGAELIVSCNGLTLRDYGGKVELGFLNDNDYGAGRIPQAELDRYLHRTDTDPGRRAPTLLTLDGVELRHVDTFVRFDGVRFVETDSWCDMDPETRKPMTTERTLIDALGNTFRVRTLGTCAYAEELVPEGTGTICGIIDYFNGEFAIRVTNRQVVFAQVSVAAPPTAYHSTAGY